MLRSLRLVVRLLGAATGVCLCAAPVALAGTTSSGNWAGYAAHRSGVHFRSVSARWRVPTGSCGSGRPTYSSIWVGLGGYSRSSTALEQTGTELDCTRVGRAVYSAWYELVPAAAHDLHLAVHAGDMIRAAVTVGGHQVTFVLQDLSDHQGFQQAFSDAEVDTTAADWIVEAPSGCDGSDTCFTLPLADFGTATITSAHAVTRSGRGGAVTSHRWGTTKIILAPRATRFFAAIANSAGAEATPSALSAGGAVFSVAYHASSSGGGPPGPPSSFFSSRLHLVHPLR